MAYKKRGKLKKMKKAEEKAKEKAEKLIKSLSKKEKAIFLTALYWGEGAKSDFGISNTTLI